MQKNLKTLRTDLELWGCTILVRNGQFAPNKTFREKSLKFFSSTNWTLSLRKTLKKNYEGGCRFVRIRHFWAENGPFSQTRIFLENLLVNLVPSIRASLHSKIKDTRINVLMKYWWLTNQRILKSHWLRAIFGNNPCMQFSQNVEQRPQELLLFTNSRQN